MTFGMLHDDPGGHFAAGYSDGAARKKFNPPSDDVPKTPPPRKAAGSSLTPLEKQWYALCDGSAFIPKYMVDYFVAALNAQGKQVAVVIGLSNFTGHTCPKCGDAGQFKIHFLGRLEHSDPDCQWTGYMGTGSYIGFQIAQIFHSGIRAGGSMKEDSDSKGDRSGGWINGILVFLFVGICRALMAVVLIPLHTIVALCQTGQKSADVVTRIITLCLIVAGLGIGYYKIHNALPPTMTGNSASYSPGNNAAGGVLPPSASSALNAGITAPPTETQTGVPPQGAPNVGNGTDANPPVATDSQSDSPNLNGSAPSQQSESAPAPNQDNTSATQIVDQHSAAKEAYDYGMQFAMKNDPDQALPYIERAIQLDPQFADAYVQKGVIEGYKGHCEAAIQEFNRALELNSRLARAYSNRGNCYWNFKNTDQAIRDYSASLALDSTQPEVFATRGMAYSKVGNWQQADPDLREAIRLGSRNLSAYHNLGYTLFMQHRYPEAIQYFDQALALQPDLALALRYRGLAKQAIGQAAEGLADLQRAHALDPKL
jgi:tetratricopeptide (TPR) repeat protein